MPIYAYKCSACGHADDVMQKVADDPLTVCPTCSRSTYARQLTAPGFQLKGSGWYVTDFRGGNSSSPAQSDGATTSKPVTEGSKTEAKAATTASTAAPAVTSPPATASSAT